MDRSRQRIMLAVGASAAVILGVVIAVIAGRGHKPAGTPVASQSGLQVSVNEAPSLDSTKKLRCFKDGAPVGEYTLAECARMNGVSAQALDVGLDESGALAAAPTASLAPPPALPPAAVQPVREPGVAIAPDVRVQPAQPLPADSRASGALCLRHTGTEWRQVSDQLGLNGCVEALFAGRCVRPGDALYGRWGDTTLRLVSGRVEQSNDNQHFRTLVEQRRGCEIPSTR